MLQGLKAAAAFGRRDPALFITAFALWSLLTGASLLMSDNAFSRTPIYAVAADIGLSDNVVGAGMVLDAVALIWGLGNRPPRIRASIAMLTGALWSFWSVLVFAGGLRVGLYSASAAWTLFCAWGLIRTSGGYAIRIPEVAP